MTTRAVKLVVVLSIINGAATAQFLQNQDISFMFGRSVAASQKVPGTGVTVTTSGGFIEQTAYGYQLRSTAKGSLWLDVPFDFPNRGKTTIAGTNQKADSGNSSTILTPGLRFQVMPHPRWALYGIAGFGFASFHYVGVSPGTTPAVTYHTDTYHGAGEIGGGIDFRLNQPFSLRVEVRDFISGHNLGGASGPNHVVYMLGIALHH
jgi:hypothetical protein